jgi:AraC-like DNA-binding protein
MSKHFRVPVRILARLEESGVGLAQLAEHSGLAPGVLHQPRVLLNTEDLFAVWHGIGALSADPAIGLKLGTETRSEHFDPVGMAALSTRNFGDAMLQMARYKQLSCPEEIVHERDEVEWSIHFRWMLADGPEPSALTDLCFAWVLSIARVGTGTPITPVRLELEGPRQHAKTMERHFGCPVHVGSSRNAIVFRTRDAEIPFVTRNPELLQMLAPQFDEALEQSRAHESFPDRVRAAIQRKLTGTRPRMEEIARDMRISTRTLQRRLQESGLSFQQVLEEARHQLARHYLSHAMLEVNETAYLLGYHDLSSFVRAFRAWEGVPPAHWRGTQRMKVAV